MAGIAMNAAPPLPDRMADIVVPYDDVSAATWRLAHGALADYLPTHSVRAYRWGGLRPPLPRCDRPRSSRPADLPERPAASMVDKSLVRPSGEVQSGRSRTAQEGDPMGDPRDMAAKFEEVLKAGNFGGMTELIQEYATDDFVEEWPQSGERLSKAASARMAESYPEMSGKTPTFKYRRMLGGGDVFVVEGTIDYGDGVPVSYVGVGEMRDGKVARMTEYFANPFEAPAWRADFVQRMEPAKV
jgi:hypothetical protein